MKNNPLKELESFGQSVWLDYIQRSLMTSGHLKKLIEEDGLGGMTSNPSIFEHAIAHSTDYDQEISNLVKSGQDVENIYETLTIQDVQAAADVFRPLYNKLNGLDGYVSLEVNPHLARDTEGTLKEARRLWKLLNRPNTLIKVPATKEGLPAIRQLISEGINVNVTLLFGLERYRQVADAYVSGLEDRLAKGEPIDRIASVASFFLSRIDTLVDPILSKTDPTIQGQTAIASAKLAYDIFERIFKGQQFQKLKENGAHVQRLLWASTSTKNPSYSDVKYVDGLIGPETVNTVPMETLDAYRDHGQPSLTLHNGKEAAIKLFEKLSAIDIDMHSVTQQLEDEGVQKFETSFDQLMKSLQEKSLKRESK
jgi:transaldolase